MGILGKENSGWIKFPEKLSKQSSLRKRKVRIYVLDRHRKGKALQSLIKCSKKKCERSIKRTGSHSTEDLTTEDLKAFLFRKKGTFKLYQTLEEINHALQKAKTQGFQPVKETSRAKGKDPIRESVDDRLASVDLLTRNKQIDPKEFKQLKEQFKRKYPDNRFTLKRTNQGQIKWEAENKTNWKDVLEVVGYSKSKGRSLHINTGTHGTPQGDTVVQDKQLADAQFTKEDMITIWHEDKVSIHVVSHHSPALTSDKYPYIDIVDAWCFSIMKPSLRDDALKILGNTALANKISDFFEKFSKLSSGSASASPSAGAGTTSNIVNSPSTNYGYQVSGNNNQVGTGSHNNVGSSWSSASTSQQQQGAATSSLSSNKRPRPLQVRSTPLETSAGASNPTSPSGASAAALTTQNPAMFGRNGNAVKRQKTGEFKQVASSQRGNSGKKKATNSPKSSRK